MGEIVNEFAQICLIMEANFGDDPLGSKGKSSYFVLILFL